ncbi:MAG TPA: glycosyltransferase [Methylocella sp.]|nr:glycosyltransferase [Methylocella sp.]
MFPQAPGESSAPAAEPAAPAQSLAGKTAVIVHPAWHSCGSHQVFVTQARAYRRLGAKVISLAIADTPGCVAGSHAAESYLAATKDLNADMRFVAGMPLKSIWRGSFLSAGRRWLHGNFAAMRLEVARLTPIPEAFGSLPRIDLIHCNHFFCMPVAEKLRAWHGAPVILETHDLQARQYALRIRKGFRLPPRASYKDLLRLECDALRPADILAHLSREEASAFRKLLPRCQHALLYPAVEPMPAGEGGGDPILVASGNFPNFLSVAWLLREVLPLTGGIPVQIFGNIDRAMRRRAPKLFNAYAACFKGQAGTEALKDAYRRASMVLLPAIAGHGISIKTIEALSSGAPLIAAPLAFRGFEASVRDLANVTVAEDAAGFAAAMRRAYEARLRPAADRGLSPSRLYYEEHFSFPAYLRRLLPLLGKALI